MEMGKMSEKRFIVFPNNVVWDNQLGEVVCRCILEGIGDAENVCQRLNELNEENKKLRQERERWIDKTDKLEQYIDSLFWGNTHICKHLDVEMVKFWCDKEKKYHIPHCTYEDCFKEENLVKTADEVLRSVDDE